MLVTLTQNLSFSRSRLVLYQDCRARPSRRFCAAGTMWQEKSGLTLAPWWVEAKGYSSQLFPGGRGIEDGHAVRRLARIRAWSMVRVSAGP